MDLQSFTHCLPLQGETIQQFLIRNIFFQNIAQLYKGGYLKYFHQNLPFQYFQTIKHRTISTLNQIFKENLVGQVLHFGSTSVKGMPGYAFPDFALEIKSFPPSRQIILKMHQKGFICFGNFAGQKNDVGFVRPYASQGTIQFAIMIHVLEAGCHKIQKFAQSVRKLHEPQNFEQYKRIKLQKIKASKGESTAEFMDYKLSKNKEVAKWVNKE